MKDVVAVGDEAAPLLNADVVIAPVLCEAPDYVKQAVFGSRNGCIYEAIALAGVNIVLDSSRADNRSARGDHAREIEGPIVRRVRGDL